MIKLIVELIGLTLACLLLYVWLLTLKNHGMIVAQCEEKGGEFTYVTSKGYQCLNKGEKDV